MSTPATRSREYWEEQRERRRSPTHPVVEAFARPKIAHLLAVVAFDGPKRALDVGCGNGYVTYHFPKELRPIGLDLSAAMLAQNPCRPAVQGSASELPFVSESFDLVFCTNLLHHVTDPGVVIREMRRVSRRYVAICEPNRWNPLMIALGLLNSEERGTLRSSPRRMRLLVEEAGMRVVNQRTAGFVTPTRMPLWLANVLRRWEAPNAVAAYTMVVGVK